RGVVLEPAQDVAHALGRDVDDVLIAGDDRVMPYRIAELRAHRRNGRMRRRIGGLAARALACRLRRARAALEIAQPFVQVLVRHLRAFGHADAAARATAPCRSPGSDASSCRTGRSLPRSPRATGSAGPSEPGPPHDGSPRA